MKRYLKALFYCLLSFVILFSFSLVSTRAIESDIRLVITNPGEDSSKEMNVNWHASNQSTYLEYTAKEDVDFINARVVEPVCFNLPFEGLESDFQCQATISNLQPNTEYIYRIVGSEVSNTYSFKTAGADEFSFAHVTDIHSYFFGPGNNSRVNAANKVLNKINDAKALDLVLISGDLTAYGTVYEQWDALFQMDVISKTIQAYTPGNHDYYNRSASSVGVQYFNAVTNNPKNGANGVINSSYYFKYNNTLFISLNSEDAANNYTLRMNQINWLNEVTANNPADFIIVFTHRPFYTGDGENAGQARDMRSYFQEIFDNTGVDLVLSGHNHVYARTNQIYKGDKVMTPTLGTTYLTGIQIGDRYKTAATNKMEQVEEIHFGANQDGGSLITVKEDKIEIVFIKHDGTNLYNYEIHSKSSEINKDVISNSIDIVLDQNDYTKGYLNVGSVNPGLIKKITITDDNDNIISDELNPNQESLELSNLNENDLYYDLNIELLLRNSEVINKTISIYNEQLDIGYIENIEFDKQDKYILIWDNELNKSIIEKIEVYVNDELFETLTNDATSVELEINPYINNIVELIVINKDNVIVATYKSVFIKQEEVINLSIDEELININIGDKYLLKVNTDPVSDIKLIFSSSDNNVAIVSADGVIEGINEGSCIVKIAVSDKEDVFIEVEVNVEKEVIKDKDILPKSNTIWIYIISASIIFLALAAYLFFKFMYFKRKI